MVRSCRDRPGPGIRGAARARGVGGGATYYVGTLSDARSPAHCGDPANGDCTLRDALIVATSGTDMIRFRSGLSGTITLRQELGTLMLTASVTIMGPGAGALAIDGGHTTAGSACGIADDGVEVLAVGSGVTAAISGVTVQHGCSDIGVIPNTDRLTGTPGGGIDNQGTMSLTDVVVAHNRTGATEHDPRALGGGGIMNSGVLTLTRVTVSDNIANGNGGGVMNTGTLTVDASTITGNVLELPTGGFGCDTTGGGIASCGVCSFSIGCAPNTPPMLTIRNSTIDHNRGGIGGGISNLDSVATIIDSTVRDNSSVAGDSLVGAGGGIFDTYDLTLIGTTVANNTVQYQIGEGGGIAILGIRFSPLGHIKLVNSTVSGNSVGSPSSCSIGGGLASDGAASVAIVHSTIVGNQLITQPGCQGSVDGGGIYTHDSISLVSSIVAENTIPPGGVGPDISDMSHPSGGSITGGYNLIGDNSGTALVPSFNHNLIGTGAAPLDPRVGPLADNGGPTQTRALLPGSPAIDAAGNPCATDPTTGQLVATDQRGATRPQGAACDIGAFEVVGTGAAVPTSIALVASPVPAHVGQNVLLTATVTPFATGATPKGTVTFLEGTTTLGSAAVGAGSGGNGTAALAVTFGTAGDHQMTARYTPGNNGFAGSTSTAVTVAVGAPTAIGIAPVAAPASRPGSAGTNAQTPQPAPSGRSGSPMPGTAGTTGGGAPAPLPTGR